MQLHVKFQTSTPISKIDHHQLTKSRSKRRQESKPNLFVHGLAFGLDVGIGIEIVGLEDLELVGELDPTLLRVGLLQPRRDHSRRLRRPRSRRFGRSHRSNLFLQSNLTPKSSRSSRIRSLRNNLLRRRWRDRGGKKGGGRTRRRRWWD